MNLPTIHRPLRSGGLLAAFAGIALFAHAQSNYFVESGKTIARIGAQGNFFYVSFVEPLGQSCQWGNLYISADRKSMYAALLSAKLAGRRLSRIDYTQPGGSGTMCNAELVEIAD
jgi:hypothetical protein